MNSKPLINYTLNSNQPENPNQSPDKPLQPYQHLSQKKNPTPGTDWIMSHGLMKILN